MRATLKYIYSLILLCSLFVFLLVEQAYAASFQTDHYEIMNIEKVYGTTKLDNPVITPSDYGFFPGWLMDEQRKMIYLAPSFTNSILFLDPNSLKVIKKFTLPENVVDLEKVNNHLFVASGSQIDVINLDEKKLVETYKFNQDIYDFVIYKDKIIYQSKSTDRYYEYRWAEKFETEIHFTYPYGQFIRLDRLGIDEANGFLYLFDDDEIMQFNADTYEMIRESNPAHSRLATSIKNPRGRAFIADGDFFYGNRKLNRSNILHVEAMFNSEIKHVSKDFIFTKDTVYDRKNYRKIQELIKTKSYTISEPEYLTNNEYLFIYLPKEQKIIKTKLLLKPKSLVFLAKPAFIDFNDPITDYYYDSANKRIYLLFMNRNELVVLNTVNMSIIKTMTVGSMPSDLKIYNGKIYISFKGQSKLLEITTNFLTQRYIELEKQVHEFEIMDNGFLFFQSYNVDTSEIYRLNLNTGQIEKVHRKQIDSAFPLIKDGNQLYMLKYSSYSIFDENGLEKKVLEASFNANYYSSPFFIRDSYLYLGNKKVLLSGETIKIEDYQQVFYSDKQDYLLNFTDNTYVSNLAVYNGMTKTKLSDLPEEASGFIIDDQKNGYLINKNGKGMTKLTYPYNINPKNRRLPYLPNTSVYNGPALRDISRSFAKKEIEYLMGLGIITGYPDRTFQPKQTISNVQAAVMLARAVDLYGNDVSMPRLINVNYSHPNYSLLMEQLYHEPITPIFKYSHEKTTRKEMAEAIYATFGLIGSKQVHYVDLTAYNSYRYRPAIEALSYHGISKGYGNNTFKPDSLLTREEFAALLARALNERYKLK